MFALNMNKKLAKPVALLLLFSFVFGIFPIHPAEAADLDVADGVYTIQVAASGMYLSVEKPGREGDGSQILISKQPYLWKVTHRNGHLQISPKDRVDLTIEVSNGLLDYGAKVQLWRNNSNHQCKELSAVYAGKTALGETKVYLRIEHSGLVLDVANGNLSREGNQVWQWYNHPGSDPQSSAQQFVFKRIEESAKIQFIQNNKAEFIKQAKDVQNYTDQILEITGMIIGTDAWFRNLGIFTGSATTAFATSVKNMATDYDNILASANILMMSSCADQAKYHSKELIKLLDKPISEQSSKQVMQHWKEMIYYRQIVAGLSSEYVNAYAKLGNVSKSERALYFSEKYLEGAFGGALNGFDDWGILVKRLKTSLEHGTNTLSAIYDIFQFHQSVENANKVKNQCDEVIQKYNAL